MCQLEHKIIGNLEDGSPITLFTLKNSSGMQVSISNYGGIVTSIKVQDKHSNFKEVVLGFDELQDYRNCPHYIGALIGRFGNRIKNGEFSLDGVKYTLAKNINSHHLHGGNQGFDKKLWNASFENESLTLNYCSPHMEEGYPGNLSVEVVFSLTESNELIMSYHAVTDQPTVLNLTHHSYFNLSGNFESDVLDHVMQINASQFVQVDEHSIPTGALTRVENTPFDFRTPMQIGKRIDDDDPQLRFGNGYDHSWVVDKKRPDELFTIAQVYHPISGIKMVVKTTEPAVQCYTGNFLGGGDIGRNGIPIRKRGGFCLETQHLPDSPNQPNFPSTVLRPNEVFKSTTVYAFSSE